MKTWEEAAAAAAEHIYPWGSVGSGFNDSRSSDIWNLREMFAGGDNVLAAAEYAESLAGAALRDLAGSSVLTPFAKDTRDEILELIARKQHDYGSGNILAFGEKGIIVRLSDKVERYKNLKARGTEDATGESLRDTLVDIIGYAIVLRMLHDGTFELPLQKDLDALEAAKRAEAAKVKNNAAWTAQPESTHEDDIRAIVREELEAYHEARTISDGPLSYGANDSTWRRYAANAFGGR